MSEVTRGLQKIEFGDIAADGGMGTTLSELGYTYKDSFAFNTEDGTQIEHYAEEVDDPIIALEKPGKITIEFDVMNPDINTLQRVLGGTIDGDKWTAPATSVAKEWSCKVTPEQGLIFEVPRVSVTGTLSGTYSKDGIFLVHVKCTVLVPKKEGLGKVMMYLKPEDTGGTTRTVAETKTK